MASKENQKKTKIHIGDTNKEVMFSGVTISATGDFNISNLSQGKNVNYRQTKDNSKPSDKKKGLNSEQTVPNEEVNDQDSFTKDHSIEQEHQSQKYQVQTVNENFELLGEIGSGGFGTVFKIKDKLDDQVYALKKISFKYQESIDLILREVKTLAQISGDGVVRYMNSWIENESNCLCIKMEYCSHNLNDIIDKKRQLFDRHSSQPMNLIEYYFSFEILKELLICVQYLHELKPQIIHRDLKPQNILILDKPTNGRYLKLCDFGLAIIHDSEYVSHTASVGTLKYMAPEISSGRYNSKVDIYSIGKITEQLFDLDIYESESITSETSSLTEKLNRMTQIIISMTNVIYNQRPSCDQLLITLSECSADNREIINHFSYKTLFGVQNELNSLFRDYLNRL